MSRSSDHVTIHTKKYYRVVLEGIDTSLETPESFAVKLATRLHVSYPRAKLVVSQLPYLAKSGITAAQANRLKTILEEMGGKARVESHLVTPKDTGEPTEGSGISFVEGQGRIVCPACGWEAKEGATHCSLCYRKFRDRASRPQSLEERIPATNPLDVDEDASPSLFLLLWRIARRHQLAILLGVIAVLVVFLVAK